MGKVAIGIFCMMVFVSGICGAVTANQQADRDVANAIWGSPQNWNQNPHPDANYFDHAVPIGLGARALGMGEAFTALSDDLSGIWWNPAGLIQMEHNEVHWMGGDRLLGNAPFTGFGAASYMLNNRMTFAVAFERPYHPVGKYPDVIASDPAQGYKFSNDRWSGNGPLIIPGNPGTKTPFFDITDSKVQDFLAEAYRLWINPPFQENVLVGTFATPLSTDLNLSFGINVKYMFQDSSYMADGDYLNKVEGWGADMGFLYRVPLTRFGRELSFGIDLRDVASQVKFDNSREITIPVVTTLGVAWKTIDFLTRSKLNLAYDFVYINDPGLDPSSNRRMNLGGEMWFYNDHIAPRMGYSIFFDQPSRATIGISFKYTVGLDYAYHFPALSESEGSHWFSVVFRWGGPIVAIPQPDVSISADPPIFSPKAGEIVTFTLAADSKNGVDRWNLNIIDKNNQVVKSYQDRGTPPNQILWGGEDKTYRLLPDGEYTYLFTANDNLGTGSSTPVQTLKIYTEPDIPPNIENIEALRKLIKKQEGEEETVDKLIQKNTRAELAAMIKKKDLFSSLPDVSKEPKVPEPVTPLAEARAEAGSFSYPRAGDIPFPKTSIMTNPSGQKSFVVEYSTAQTQPRFILSDMSDIVRVAARDVGESVSVYDVRARYGQREIKMVAPSTAALSFSRGFLKEDQLYKVSVVTLDGAPMQPSY